LVTCKECAGAVSDKAKNCPHCGVQLQPSGSRYKWIVWLVFGAFMLFLLVGALMPSKPYSEQDRLMDTYRMCLKDMADPLKSASEREAHRTVCRELRDELRQKHGVHVE